MTTLPQSIKNRPLYRWRCIAHARPVRDGGGSLALPLIGDRFISCRTSQICLCWLRCWLRASNGCNDQNSEEHQQVPWIRHCCFGSSSSTPTQGAPATRANSATCSCGAQPPIITGRPEDVKKLFLPKNGARSGPSARTWALGNGQMENREVTSRFYMEYPRVEEQLQSIEMKYLSSAFLLPHSSKTH